MNKGSAVPFRFAALSSLNVRLLQIVTTIIHNKMPRKLHTVSVNRTPTRASKHQPSGAAVRMISARLEEDIVLGRLQPRERLVEQGLADRFATHRAAVRQALF